ncbi:serine O-acetyltransferase [Vibrio breoganii]
MRKNTIIEDFKLNSFISFLTLLEYRIKNYLFVRESKARLSIVKVIFMLVGIIIRIESQISYKATLGRRIKLPHKGNGVVISKYAMIGDDVVIYHQVTLGVRPSKKERFHIGNNVVISTGSKVISSNVGDRSRLAANSVVYKDVEKNVFYK